MSINTRHYSGATSTLHDDGRDFVLPISAGYADEYRITTWPDGSAVVTYLAHDEYGGDHWTADELFMGWEYMILRHQRDADLLYERLHDEPSEWRKALDDGRAFFIEKYEHGLVRYALQGESSAVDRQWDVTGVAGFMVSDGEWGKDVDLREAARNTLETYTDWCNNNIFGVVTVIFDAEGNQVGEEDVCWGYIGDDYALSVLNEEHDAYVKEATP